MINNLIYLVTIVLAIAGIIISVWSLNLTSRNKVSNYLTTSNTPFSILSAHKIIDKQLIDSKEYWKAIAVLGELLLLEEESEEKKIFTKEDMYQSYF